MGSPRIAEEEAPETRQRPRRAPIVRSLQPKTREIRLHYISYYGDITPFGMSNLRALVLAAREQGVDELTICLASKGGDVDSGIATFNFLRHLPVPVINMHADGNIASIAATLLLAGKTRTATPTSSFCLHQASYSEGQHQGKRAPSTDLISRPFRDILKWSDDQIAHRFTAEDFLFSPEQAVDLGCVNEIKKLKFKPGDSIVDTRCIP